MPVDLLGVSGLSKSYGQVVALNDVSFSVRRGEILGLIGPNGAGKTTLFECVAGVQPPDRGDVIQSSGNRRSDILFYVPDGIAPWPEQPLWWVLEYAIGFFRGPQHLYPDVVDSLELTSLLNMKLGALSKGQRKRALLAMGLLTPQPILLIDEPFNGLDLRQSREAVETFRWHVAQGRTLFLSIHEIAQAAKICDRFVLLSDGRVCAEGSLTELTALAARRAQSPLADFEEVFLALT
jgi:ABC-2 type transport system ATP-binding protein